MPQPQTNPNITENSKHQYRNPVYLVRQWQQDLADVKYVSRADLSRKMGVSRARVTQVLNLLRLPEDVIEKVWSMSDPLPKSIITERGLRALLENNISRDGHPST
jgi:hypothetical protein